MIATLNADYVRNVSVKPGGIKYMLSRETTLKAAFEVGAAAEIWLANQIYNCVVRSGKTMPPAQAIKETAATIYAMFPYVQISVISLFFGYLQIGQRFDEYGEIEHFGEFGLNTMISELRKHIARANKLYLTLKAKRQRIAEREAMEAIPPMDWDKELAEHPERYTHIADIIRRFDCKVEVNKI